MNRLFSITWTLPSVSIGKLKSSTDVNSLLGQPFRFTIRTVSVKKREHTKTQKMFVTGDFQKKMSCPCQIRVTSVVLYVMYYFTFFYISFTSFSFGSNLVQSKLLQFGLVSADPKGVLTVQSNENSVSVQLGHLHSLNRFGVCKKESKGENQTKQKNSTSLQLIPMTHIQTQPRCLTLNIILL